MNGKHGRKPWKKGTFSKRLIAPYSPTQEDYAFMERLLLGQDSTFLAFNKPSGLPCQTRNPDDRTFDKLLAVFAKSNGKRPRLVHRLDAQTSGVIIAARTQPAAAFFSAAFADRVAQKTYLAVVAGQPFDRAEGGIEAALERYQAQPNLALMRAAGPEASDAQTASTRYRVLASKDRHHWLELKPETGRMHQIRAHLAHVGRPILGDPYYGGELSAGGTAARRLMLHASELLIPHPVGGEIDLSAPMPPDMLAVLAAAGLKSELAGSGETG